MDTDIGKTKSGKRAKLMVVADGRGVPTGVRIAPASPAEVTLIESTLEQVAVPRSGPGRPRMKPRRLIYDKAADSDAPGLRLKKHGIELIYPHRANRKRPSLQNDRSLRRCPIRPQLQDVLGHPQGRLPDDHLSTVLKPLLLKRRPRQTEYRASDYFVIVPQRAAVSGAVRRTDSTAVDFMVPVKAAGTAWIEGGYFR
jgi:hypothetical protein